MQAQCTADAVARQAQSNADAMERILTKFAPSASPALSITSDSGASGSSSSVTTTTKVKVPPWTDDQKPQAYFLKFEKAMVCNGEPKSRWGHLLPIYISGKLEPAFHSEIPMDMMANFNEVKFKLLKSLGDTPLHAARQWWSISKQPDENHNAFFQRPNNINIRRLEEVNTKQEIINSISLSKFLHSLSHNYFAFVTSRNPATGSEAAELATEFYQSQSRFRSRHYYSMRQHPQTSPGGRKDGQPSNSGVDPVVNTGTSTQGAVEQSNGGNQSKSGNKFN